MLQKFFLLFLTVFCINTYGRDFKTNELDGVWRSDKLNFYLDIKNGIFSRYQFTSMSCFNGAAGYLPAAGQITDSHIAQNFRYQLTDPQTLLIYRTQEAIPVQLKRVSKLPYYCKGQPIDTPLSNFYIFWHTFNELYHFSGYSKKQWLALYNQESGNFVDLDMIIFDTEEGEQFYLFENLKQLIEQVGDAHVFIMANSLGLTVFGDDKRHHFSDEDRTYYSNITQISNGDISHNYKFKIRNFHRNLAVGYDKNQQVVLVQLSSLTGWDSNGLFTDEGKKKFLLDIDKVRTFINTKRVKKIIIDLRLNDGGSIAYANVFAGLFCSEPHIASYIEPNKQKGLMMPLAHTQCRKPIKALDIPIDVLTSKYTASAAEHLALLLRASGARLIGEETRGAYSPVVLKSLPNGWVIGIPPYRIFDRNKKHLIERQGIIPDFKVTSFTNTNKTHRSSGE